MANVGVIGLGYVGLTLSIIAAKKGLNVYGIENNKDTLTSIKNGKAHFFEKGLDNALSNVLDKKLFIDEKFDKKINFDYFIITVGSPLYPETKIPNTDYVANAIASIEDFYTGNELIILRSTVSVGVTRKIVLPLLNKISGVDQEKILLAFCPERTIEGDALSELVTIPQIIGANNEESFKKSEELFRQITPTVLRVESLEAAELVKLFNNTYRDIHFSIGNYFNEIAQSFGINGVNLIETANYHYNRSRIAKPGLVGGPCLEKDSYILVNNMVNSRGKDFVLGARLYNESLEDSIIKWIFKKTNEYKIKEIGISGMAFKGRPDNSDIRGSSSINIVNKLKEHFNEIRIHDFLVPNKDCSSLGNFYSDFYKMIKGLSLVIILNNNTRYNNLKISKMETIMCQPYLIFDTWSNLDSLRLDSKLNISTLGNIYL